LGANQERAEREDLWKEERLKEMKDAKRRTGRSMISDTSKSRKLALPFAPFSLNTPFGLVFSCSSLLIRPPKRPSTQSMPMYGPVNCFVVSVEKDLQPVPGQEAMRKSSTGEGAGEVDEFGVMGALSKASSNWCRSGLLRDKYREERRQTYVKEDILARRKAVHSGESFAKDTPIQFIRT
jgi:hypothetical protein